MRISIALMCLIFSIQPAFTKVKLCPQTSSEIVFCTSKQAVPMFPFIAVCKDSTGANQLMVDVGMARSAEEYNVREVENNTSVTYVVTDADTDNAKFDVKKSATKKTEAIFSYDLYGSRVNDEYLCKLP